LTKTTGPQDIQDAFRAVGLTFNDAIARGVLAGALVVESDAKALVHVQSGTLKRSITHTEPEIVDGVATAQVGTNVEYAPMEEFGSKGREPHPYLAPALERNVNMVKSLIAQSIKTEFPG
jgi:HK97 gp10 family phage protein